jgi:predicted nuclease with TOPRIM domain
MQALLPSPKLGAKDAAAKSPELSSAAQSSNSKAAKVESAIEYIKQLQKECSEKDQLLSKKDQEVGALRKELDALKKGASTSSSAIAETEVQMQTGDTSNSDSEKDATRKAG